MVESRKIKNTSKKDDSNYLKKLDEYFTKSVGTNVEKISNFTKYIPRQDLTRFLAKYEIFKKILNVEGAIVEGGVRFGGGLMTFAQLSSILEPVNYTRKIIGFDTFSGFPNLTEHDKGSTSNFAHKGGLAVNSFNDLKECIALYDSNRFIGHIPKVELVKGDVTLTIPKYLRENPHTVVSLLYLDFDIYKPTKIALQNFVPRMPKGAIIVFDELNSKEWVGETKAVLETIGIRNLRIERFSFNTYMSYAVLD
ncbi:MAG: class I SAM-dependent methyltransferase [Thaumarchaeota archaeon]|nr:class I SAM-dependent methyltransferase [Nitrososphaerota archaeon]MBI3641321.1 class I SAM-dependent methyltransferase [Nitrososphaerota archaeon]